jgi:hypothetical protein
VYDEESIAFPSILLGLYFSAGSRLLPRYDHKFGFPFLSTNYSSILLPSRPRRVVSPSQSLVVLPHQFYTNQLLAIHCFPSHYVPSLIIYRSTGCWMIQSRDTSAACARPSHVHAAHFLRLRRGVFARRLSLVVHTTVPVDALLKLMRRLPFVGCSAFTVLPAFAVQNEHRSAGRPV